MKVFVSDRYSPVRERLVSMISAIEGVEIVGQDEEALSVIEAVERLEPDAVVLDMRPGVLDELSKLRQIKTGENGRVVIVLVDGPFFSYKDKLLGAGADFVFHRSNEFKGVLSLIANMSERRS